LTGAQPDDPSAVAHAVIEAVTADRSPLRLPLGSEALDAIRAKLDEQRRELDTWQQLGTSTAFEAT
jgi:hypothetical protein